MNQEHPLARHMRAEGISVADFAAKVGMSRQTVYRIIKREQSPPLGTLAKICAATNGAVTPNDFIALPAAAE